MDLKSIIPEKANLKKGDRDAVSMTFDTSKIKSTVTNPSQVFKGISVDDEKKILNYVKQNYSNGSKFEQQQAMQGLYNAALKAQKQKDIDAGMQEVKLHWINQANNAKSTKEKNIYNSQLKKADLADLIKDQYIKMGYKASDMMNLTPEGVIAGFLETNPEYKDSFNKYFYNDKKDATSLGKDLGWIEKSTKEELIGNEGDLSSWGKLGNIAEGWAGWTPKRGEGVRDILDWGLAGTESNVSRDKDLENTAFMNYVQDKYGTVPANLTDRDLKQAKKDFENVDKGQYTPNLVRGLANSAMGLTDIGFTSATMGLGRPLIKEVGSNVLKRLGVKGAENLAEKSSVEGFKWLYKQGGKNALRNNNLFKLGFATASETPGLEIAPEFLGDVLSTIGAQLNKLPIMKDIRDSLPTEQDKADWDAFVAGHWIGLVKRGVKNAWDVKDADIQTLKDSYDKIKNGDVDGGVKLLKENSKENKLNKIKEKNQEAKLDAAQQVTQAKYEAREAAAKGLDTLRENGKLKKVKNINDLENNTAELENSLKEEQTKIAEKEKKTFGEEDLLYQDEKPVLDENGNKTTQPSIDSPFRTLLDDIISYYEKTDPSEAITWKSYKRAFESGKLPTEVILEIKREGNYLNQSVFNDKTNVLKDTDMADKFSKNMKKVNSVVENLDIGPDLRAIDEKLSGLYTVKKAIKQIRKRASEYKMTQPNRSNFSKKLGRFAGKWINRLSFGGAGWVLKTFLAALQEMGADLTKEKYNPLEIQQNVKNFVNDYNKLMDKMEGATSSSIIDKLAKEFIDKWQLEAQYNEDD